MTIFAQKIYEVVLEIPRGRVMTYGQVARLAGNPRGARGVGFTLSRCPESDGTPCHRVIHGDGSLCPGWASQRSLLEAEGVGFLEDGRVDLREYGVI